MYLKKKKSSCTLPDSLHVLPFPKYSPKRSNLLFCSSVCIYKIQRLVEIQKAYFQLWTLQSPKKTLDEQTDNTHITSQQESPRFFPETKIKKDERKHKQSSSLRLKITNPLVDSLCSTKFPISVSFPLISVKKPTRNSKVMSKNISRLMLSFSSPKDESNATVYYNDYNKK